MGQITNTRIISVILFLVLTGILVYWQPEPNVAKKRLTLSQTLGNIDGWNNDGFFMLDEKILGILELDDYVNYNYSIGEKTISLYIGYYYTSKKVGAAHSPLVCFPGQGWTLSNSENKSLKIGKEEINFAQMVASIGPRKELLIYWFQAYERTSTGTFFQKLNTLWSKFKNRREDNAFVRITVPFKEKSPADAYDTGVKFIKAFYPRFFEYVKENYN